MQVARIFLFIVLCFPSTYIFSQQKNDSAIISSIINEAEQNSQLEKLAHELFDEIGPRLVGSPKMQQAHDWAVSKYKDGEYRPTMKSGANGADGREALRI